MPLTNDELVDSLELEDPPALDEQGMEKDEEPEPYNFQENYWLAMPYYSPDFAAAVCERFSSHLERWEGHNLGNAVWAAYRAYHSLEGAAYGGDQDPTIAITESGEDGEFLSMRMNQYRGLVKHQIALVTANRPSWDPQARTTDSEAMRQVSLAAHLLDYEMDVKGMGVALKTQYEIAKVCASGFLAQGWNENVGPNGSGATWALPLAPWEVAHERVRVYEDANWHIFRSYESRWDWVAKFAKADPEKAEKIAAISNQSHIANAFLYEDNGLSSADTDRFEVLIVYAKPTAACPEGRVAYIADEALILMDGPSPYGDDVPITRICPAEFVGTSVPFGDSWTLLAPDEAYNAILSMGITRVDTHGVANIAVPTGSDFKQSDFSGNNLLEVTPGQEPKVLDMLAIPPELAQWMNIIKTGMEELSGINSVTRGNPQENVSSGSYAALLQAMAVQFNSADEAAWVYNLEKTGSHKINIYRRLADEKQLVNICGADETWSAREFVGEDLSQILRVGVKVGNALSKTVAGRLALATTMLEQKLIQDPREFLQCVQTGNYEPLFAGPARQLILIKSENERIMRGEKPRVWVYDNDQLHIREHLELMDTPLRDDLEKSKGVQAHIDEHMLSWTNKTLNSPDILAAIGQPPLPAAQATQQATEQQSGGGAGPASPGPRQQEQPSTEAPPKGKPGPEGAPPGQEPGPMPAQPQPAKTPGGEAVV